MVIIDPDDSARAIAEFAGIRFEKVALQPDTLRDILSPLLAPGGFLVNLSVGVSSVALVELCREHGALYLDTCIEPPPGGYTDPTKSISERSNYAMRESALALRRARPRSNRRDRAWRQSGPGQPPGEAGPAAPGARSRPHSQPANAARIGAAWHAISA